MGTFTVKSRLPQIAREITRAARAAVKEEGAEMKEEARAACPVSDNNAPGHVHTRDTIEAEISRDGLGVELGAGGAILFIEFGTSHAAARPVLRPVAATSRKRLPRRLSKALKKVG